jgi:hypothetical protein
LTAGLSLEQAPPFNVPLRFFLTAPWFLVLAALTDCCGKGPDIFASRWLPAALALTHLLTLGFMAQVMLGALLQMLPVVVGVVVPRPRLTAALIHIPLTLGDAGAGRSHFWWRTPLVPRCRSVCSALGFGVALLAIHLALWRAPVAGGTVIALRCALGVAGHGQCWRCCWSGFFGLGLALPVAALTNCTPSGGLMGWTRIAGGGGRLSGRADVPDHPALSVVAESGIRAADGRAAGAVVDVLLIGWRAAAG